MKTKKMISGAAAAVAMLSLSGVANADHGASCAPALLDEALDMAYRITCESHYAAAGFTTRPGVTPWPSMNPLWQRQVGKYKNNPDMLVELGCDVHSDLVKKLYVERDDTPPPKRNKKNSNDATGVVNALDPLNLKFQSAVDSLESFKVMVDASVPNETSKNFPALPGNATPSQGDWEEYLKGWADDLIYKIKVCGHIDL